MMKTTKLLATAAIAAIAMAGCSKSEPGGNQGSEKTVTIKVVTAGITKAIDKTPVTYGYKTPVNDVTLYFLDGNDRVVSEALHMVGTEITTGKKFENINASAVKVYVVANTLDGTTPLFSGLGTVNLNHPKSEIADMSAPVSTQMDITAKGVDSVVLSGESSFTPVAASEYAASVELIPAVCRFEATSITAIQGVNAVTKFDLEGIYLNTYYTGFTIGGGYIPGTYYGLSLNATDLTVVDNSMKDTGLNKTGSLTYNSSTGKVWAYMLPVGNTAPIIIFKLVNVEVNGVLSGNGTKYITVTSFQDATTHQMIAPKRGEVYSIRDVAFTPADITDNPNQHDISVTVTVDVMGWKVYAVDPLF